MSFEILYTSAPQGLRKGSRGYCTVVSTRGIPKTLAERLESRSGYPHPFPPGDAKNPVNYSHLVLTVGGVSYHLLSRIADCGFDYSQRSNKLAHHVALAESELTAGGPAWVLDGEGFCVKEWDGTPQLLPGGRAARTDPCPGGVCRAWNKLAGDAGWAGILAENAVSDEKKTAFVVFKPGDDMLPLVVEALGLLPPEDRWRTTFSTYYTKLQSGDALRWRFVLDGTPEAESARRDPRITLIDLARPLGRAPDGPYAEFARTGTMPLPTPPTTPKEESPDFVPLEPIASPPVAGGPASGTSTGPPPVGYGLSTPAPGRDRGIDLTESFPVDARRPTQPLLKRRKRRWWIWLIAALVLVSAGIGALWFSDFGKAVPRQVGAAGASADAKPYAERKGNEGAKQSERLGDPESEADNPSGEATQEASEEGGEEAKEEEHPTNSDQDRAVTEEDTRAAEDPSKSSDGGPGPDTNKETENSKVVKSLRDLLPDADDDCLELPESQQNLFKQPKSHSWELKIDDPKELKIELLGSDSIARNDVAERFKIAEDRENLSDGVLWEVSHAIGDPNENTPQNGSKSVVLGHFKVKPRLLVFQPKYESPTIGRYEVLRHALLRFSCGNEHRICRLRKATPGHLTLEGPSSERSYTRWVFNTESTRGVSPFRFWMNHKDWKDEPLPARNSLRIDLCLRNCIENVCEERTFSFLATTTNAGICTPTLKFLSDDSAGVQLAIQVKETERQFELQIQASSKLAYLGQSLDAGLVAIHALKEFDLTAGQVKADEASKEYFFDSDSVKTIRRDRKRAEKELDRIKDIHWKKKAENERLSNNKSEAKKWCKAADAWLENAAWFQKELPKRLQNGEAEIEARLYAEVRCDAKEPEAAPTETPGIVKVPIAVFSTKKEERKTESSGRGDLLGK